MDIYSLTIKKSKYPNIKMNSGSVVAEVMTEIINNVSELDINKEHSFCICLNPVLKIIKIELIALGDLTSTMMAPREIFLSAIKSNAHSIICVHNHPSGSPYPSPADEYVAKILGCGGVIFNIPLIDFVVITKNKDVFYSFRDNTDLLENSKDQVNQILSKY